VVHRSLPGRLPAAFLGHLLSLAILAATAFGADAEYKRILIEPAENAVEARLPLTDVTGPARVKRREEAGVGIPVAPTRTKLDETCYIEWQISYDTTDLSHWSAVPAIRFQRDARTKYGCELSKLLAESLRLGLLSEAQLRTLRAELDDLREVTLEEHEKMAIAPDGSKAGGQGLPAGFSRYIERVPVVQKETEHGRVEIRLKQKQRAVGYQAMVYACIPLAQWSRPGGALRGPGPARSKETVTVRFTKDNVGYLLDLVRAFGVASREHNDDLGKILDALLAS
jgi:hypothetical protein